MAFTGVAVSPNSDGLDLAAGRSSYREPEAILMYLAVPDSPLAPRQVLASDSIASVKLRMQNSKGLVVSNQKLVFEGRELSRNGCLIRDYGVGYRGVLRLAIRLSEIRLMTVRTVYGRKVKFHVDHGRHAGHIKQEAAAYEGEYFSDLGDQKLLLGKDELDDRRLIADICKNSDAVVHLLISKSAKFSTKPIDRDSELSVTAPNVEKKLRADATKAVERIPLVEPVAATVGLSPVVMSMIQATCAGLERGYPPVLSSEGTGGAYFIRDASGQEYVAVFKPADEEPMAGNNPRGLPLSVDGEGLKKGTRVGEGASREVAAYVLDHPVAGRRGVGDGGAGFAGVPPTALVRCLHASAGRIGNGRVEKQLKVGSLQMYMKNSGSCEDVGPRAFPVQEVHKIAVLDMRLANADRHAGNILFHKDGNGLYRLMPIDHGYCLPENFQDCTFEWLYWPQAREPFSAETLSYIKSLDAEEDIKMLKFYGWELPSKCARVLCISTMLLKKGADRGLTSFDIGRMLCRENIKNKSLIEGIVEEAEDVVLPGTSEEAFMEAVSEIMDRRLDELFNLKPGY